MKRYKSISKLILNHPFFATLLLNLERIEKDDLIAATDGCRLYINPNIEKMFGVGKTVGVLCHELLHIIFRHTKILPNNVIMPIWQMATDYAINGILIELGVPLPVEAGLYDQKYKGMTALQIYNELLKRIKSHQVNLILNPSDLPSNDNNNNNGSKSCGGRKNILGDIIKNENTNGSDAEGDELKLKQALSEATLVAKRHGKLPSSLLREIDDIINPKADWKKLLAQYICDKSSVTDYIWDKPNPRWLHTGFYIPSQGATEYDSINDTVVIAVDTSGSVFDDNNIVGTVSAELKSLLKSVNIDNIYVIYNDAKVQHVDHYFNYELDDKFKITFKGGGGTVFTPVFEWVNQNRVHPVFLLFLTDLYGSFPDYQPSYPVLWGVLTPKNASEPYTVPFGTVINIYY